MPRTTQHMQNITDQQIKRLLRTAKSAEGLIEILPERFPKAKIFIIRGKDNFTRDEDSSYTLGMHFNYIEAQKTVEQIKPNGSPNLRDTYVIVEGTVEQLRRGEVVDSFNVKNLDHFDEELAYTYLYERLTTRKRKK
jgi:hypothetical protein